MIFVIGTKQCCGVASFYAAPAPGKNLDAAMAPALLYSKAKFLK
jgi:hypothetical protein